MNLRRCAARAVLAGLVACAFVHPAPAQPAAPDIRLVLAGDGPAVFVTDAGLGKGYAALRAELTGPPYRAVTIRVIDRSPRAIPGSLGLALAGIDGAPAMLGGDTGIGAVGGTVEAAGTVVTTATEADARTQSATLVFGEPLGPRRLLVLYDGVPLTRFSAGELEARFTLTDGKSLVRRARFTAQPRVTTVFPGMQAAFAAKFGRKDPPPALAVAVSQTIANHSFGTGIPSKDINNRIYAGLDDIVMMCVGGGAFTGIGFPLPASQGAHPVISGLATLNLRDDPNAQMVYASDRTCAGCEAPGGTGIVALDSSPTEGIGSDSLPERIHRVELAAGSAALKDGPRGIVAFGPRQGSPSRTGSLFVALRGGIARIDLAEGDAGRYRAAGPAVPIAAGTRFSFGDAPHVGMALDAAFGRATRLYVADPGTKSVRAIRLADGTVSTVAGFPAVPSGLTVDPFSGTIYVSLGTLGAIYAVEPGAQPRLVAGEPGVVGASDGFGLAPYALQAAGGAAVVGAEAGPKWTTLLPANTQLDQARARLTAPGALTFEPQSASLVALDGSRMLFVR